MSGFWDDWFESTLETLLASLQQSEVCFARIQETHMPQGLELRENYILLLKELIINQSSYFDGHEAEICDVLLNCRSHGTNLVPALVQN